MESTRPYQDGMKTKPKSPDFELLKKLSANGIKIKTSLLKHCKRLTVFLSLFLIGNASHAQADLKSFTASFTGTKVKLSWNIASEDNLNYYSIDRSGDGKTYETIGLIKATGSQETITDYSFFDKSYFNNAVYYRLRCMTDAGREKSLAGIIAIQIREDVKEAAIYPIDYVPNRVYVDATKINQNKIIVDVTDADGQKLANKQLDKSQNEYAVELKSAYRLQKGNYMLTAFYSNSVIKCRLIIQDPSMNLAANASPSKQQPFTLK